MSVEGSQPLRRSRRVKKIHNYCELDSGDTTESNPDGYRQLKLMDCFGTESQVGIQSARNPPSQEQSLLEVTSEDESPIKSPPPPPPIRRKRIITLDDYGMRFEVKERPKVNRITKKFKQVTLTAILDTLM
eukprot:g11.t1